MPLSAGSHVGSYQITASLGAGGMGEVYRAHDPRLGRDVALKVLPAEMASDPARLERFTREARAIAALNHPHIVTIYSTEEADGLRFLTMELVEGQPLEALIPPTGLAPARFLELALPLADALTAAHQKQITHRDLKPANVMVATDGRVKVLDFGLARVAGPLRTHQTIEATRPVLTSEGTIVGTMPYMSPEQIEGKNLDQRTDLFSLGVMFHEMLTGSRPFSGESSPQLMSSILRDVPASVSEIRTEVPEALSRLIHRCLEKRPDDRVQTARDVYNELRHVRKQLESGSSRRKFETGSAPPVIAESLWIAVLPFTTRTSDADSLALADGLTEDVTAGLSRFAYLSVVAAHTARQHASVGSDARQLGAAMGARYLLDGSIRRAGSALRISVRLVDGGSGAQLWSDAYARDLQGSDVLTMQDDLTDRIVATVADVHGVLMRSMSREIGALRLDEDDPRALQLRYWAYHRQHAPREHGLLRDVFERVADKQPGVAPFWTALAHLYWHEHGFGFNVRPGALARARQAATRALDLDPLSQHAWEALATVYFFEHDREGFTHAIDRVLALNQRNAHAMALAGILLVHADELDRGMALTDRAIALNPDHPGWYHIARATRDYVIGEDEGALRAAKRINMPDHVWAHVLVALSAGQLDRGADATAALGAVFRVAPPFADESTVAEQARNWKWNDAHVERMLDGYRKAVALRAQTGRPGTSTIPVSIPSLSSAASSSASDQSLSGAIPQPASPLSRDRASEAGALAIAVRLFTARGGDSATDLAEGLSEDVTTGLSRFSYLRVVPRASLEGTAVAPARYVVEGQVRRAASTVRVSARLIDTMSGAQLWAENYDRPAESEVFQMQDDIVSRIVTTVADANGVMLRSMVATLRQRPIEAHTVSDLVLRFHGYVEHFDPQEHRQIRDRLTEALAGDPGHADGWACLSSLIEHEHSHDLNPRPDSLQRAREAAERSIAVNPVCQEGWRAMASAAFSARDTAGVRIAAERAIAINPLNTGTVAVCGMFLAYSGAWDRGLEVLRQAMQPNPHYPGWLHFAFFTYHYNHEEYAEALRHAKPINMPRFPKWHLTMAAVAGRLGLRDEARAALEALRRLDPAAGSDDYVRAAFASWVWTDEEMEHVVEGVRKARALAGSDVAAPPT